MDLNQFSTVDIVLDKANDNFIQKQTISAGDRDGRSLTLQVTNEGSIGEVPGLTANLLWTNHSSGVSDLSAFSVVDRATSVFKINYPQNMLTAGKVTAQIQLLHNGKVTHSKKFEIIVLDVAGKLKGVLQSAEYTALVEALAKANEFETDIAEVTAQLAGSANYSEGDILGIPENYLNLPSILGNGLGTHPSVIDFKTQWNGYRYWMAYTPYPNVINENPSIAASNDNITWVLPIGCPNPVVTAPTDTSFANSDTEIVYIPSTDKLRMYWREYRNVPLEVNYYFVESSDGVNWSEKTLSLNTTSSSSMSPSIIRKTDSTWKMWYVINSAQFGYRTSTDGINWGTETLVSQPWSNFSAWHIGVHLDSNGKYHMLGSTYPTTGMDGLQYRPIIYAHSNDGINWTPNETPQMIPSGWAGGYLYRPSFLVDSSKGLYNGNPYLKIWFGASDPNSNWHIGYTEGYIQNNGNETNTNKLIIRKNIIESFTGLFGKIKAGLVYASSIFAEKVTIKNPFSSPRLIFKDERIDSPKNNEANIIWQGNSIDSSNRMIFAFSKDGGPISTKFQIAPFGNWMGFTTPGEFLNLNKITAGSQEFTINLKDSANNSVKVINWDATKNAFSFNNYSIQDLSALRSDLLIAYDDGIRIYRNGSTSEFFRLYTDSTGGLSFLPMGGTNTSNYFKIRSDGHMQSNGNSGFMDTQFTNYKAQTSRPSLLSASRPGVYLADGVTHDPLSVATGKPYLVYYDGSYTKLS